MASVGLNIAAALAGVEIEPWLVASGCLAGTLDKQLFFSQTTRLDNKARHLLDQSKRRAVLQMYDGDLQRAETCYGPRDRRSKPGEVRLLLTTKDITAADFDVAPRMKATTVELSLSELRALFEQERLEQYIADTVPGGLLILRLESLWQGIRLCCGTVYDHVCPACYHGEQTITAIWVQPGETSPEERAKAAAARANEVVEEVRRSLDNDPSVTGVEQRLRRIGERLGREVGFTQGLIRFPNPAYPDLFLFMAHWGDSQVQNALPDVPMYQGMLGKAFDTRTPFWAESRKQFLEHERYCHPGWHVRPFQEAESQRGLLYQQFKNSIQCAAALPLGNQSHCRAVMCLSSPTARAFSEEDKQVALRLAELAAELLGPHLDELEVAARARMSRDSLELIGLSNGLNVQKSDEAITILGSSLAERSRRLSGASDVAVLLWRSDSDTFEQIGQVGANPLPVTAEANTSYRHALQQGDLCLSEVELSHRAFADVDASVRALMLVVVHDGQEPVGVLRLAYRDGVQTFCQPWKLDSLSALCDFHAAQILTHQRERLTRLLLSRLPGSDDPVTFKQETEEWFALLGRALSCNRGSIFMRDTERGDYSVWVRLKLSDGADPDNRYSSGEGRTGWVIAAGSPWLIKDASDRREYAGLQPPYQPSGKPPCWKKDERLSYLGVPVMSGSDVLSVLRLVIITRKDVSGPIKTCFTQHDYDLAQLAALKFAEVLVRHQQRRQDAALNELSDALREHKVRSSVTSRVEEALKHVLGMKEVIVRVSDYWDIGADKDPVEVLVRMEASEDRVTFPERYEKGQAIAGRIWDDRRLRRYQDGQVHALDEQGHWIAEEGTIPQERARKYNLGLLAPITAGQEFQGTLAVWQKAEGPIPQAKVLFLRRVAREMGLALKNCEEYEKLSLELVLMRALMSFSQRDKPSRADNTEQLVRSIRDALHKGLDCDLIASRAYAWLYNDTAQGHEGHGYDGLDGANRLKYDEIKLSKDTPFLVDSETPNARRLAWLVQGLSPNDQRWCYSSQLAALLLDAPGLLPKTLFLLAVQPPNRLSYKWVEGMHLVLNNLFGGRSARRAVAVQEPHRLRRDPATRREDT